MGTSISDLLDCASLREGQVISGDSGLDRVASSVTVGEVPDIGEWLSGGEIVLTTFFATPSDKKARLQFVTSIIESRAAALIIKLGRYIDHIDPEIVEIADKHEFPVIEIPPEVRWTHLIQEITERIQGSLALELRRSTEIHERLLQVVLEGGDLRRICEVSSYLQSCPVAIVDQFGLAFATSSGSIDEFSELVGDVIAGTATDNNDRKRIRIDMSGGQHLHYQPIVAGSEYLGGVVSVHKCRQIGVLDERALEHTATVAAIEISRQRLLLETEIRLGADFLDSILEERKEPSELLRRAGLLGFHLAKDGISLVIQLSPDKATEVVRTVRRLLNELTEGSMTTIKGDTIYSLIPLPAGTGGDDALDWVRSFAGRLRHDIAWRSDSADFRMGVGGVYKDPARLGSSIREAVVAAELSSRLDPGAQGVTAFKDVGAYRLLLRFMQTNPDELKALYKDSLDTVIAYDQVRGTNLLGTLETYFEMNESVNRTAERLFTHRHTVRYRLERIKELSGLDVNSSDGRETLSLAVKARHLIEGAINHEAIPS